MMGMVVVVVGEEKPNVLGPDVCFFCSFGRCSLCGRFPLSFCMVTVHYLPTY